MGLFSLFKRVRVGASRGVKLTILPGHQENFKHAKDMMRSNVLSAFLKPHEFKSFEQMLRAIERVQFVLGCNADTLAAHPEFAAPMQEMLLKSYQQLDREADLLCYEYESQQEVKEGLMQLREHVATVIKLLSRSDFVRMEPHISNLLKIKQGKGYVAVDGAHVHAFSSAQNAITILFGGMAHNAEKIEGNIWKKSGSGVFDPANMEKVSEQAKIRPACLKIFEDKHEAKRAQGFIGSHAQPLHS